MKIPFSDTKPALPDSRFPALTGGGEFKYALFPLPDISLVSGYLPTPGKLQITETGRILLTLPTAESGAIIYGLNSSLEVKDVRFTDNLEAIHNRLQKNGLLSHPLTDAERISLSRAIPFPAAPDGNNPQLQELWK